MVMCAFTEVFKWVESVEVKMIKMRKALQWIQGNFKEFQIKKDVMCLD